MRLQGTKQKGVKIAIQPYPYIKGESKGQNKSLVITEATTAQVHEFLIQCFKELEDENEQFTICVGVGGFQTGPWLTCPCHNLRGELVKDKLDDSLGPEILQELEDLQENYPKVVELMVTMIAAITDVAGNVHNLSRLTDHLEVSRLDHEWKLNTLKDIAVRQLREGDSMYSIPGGDSEPTIHQKIKLLDYLKDIQ